MRFTSQARKRAAATLVVAFAFGLGVASPASASGSQSATAGVPAKAELADTRYCELTRVGHQFVRCDNLTGEGTLAPNWVPES
jgi:hypothetical protein